IRAWVAVATCTHHEATAPRSRAPWTAGQNPPPAIRHPVEVRRWSGWGRLRPIEAVVPSTVPELTPSRVAGERDAARLYRRASLAIAGAAAAFYALFIARTAFTIDGRTFFSLFDDGMISMRYARNFAHGAGLVWNAGQHPVEGYTNFLWTAWMAVLHLTGVS